MSQRALAELIKVDFSYISKIENGRLPAPSADTVLAMAKTLGVEPARLLALTRKLPSGIEEHVASSPAAQEFLLAAEQLDLSDGEWQEMARKLDELRAERRE
jgi:transcriptional regulator with XRE-family HTH domain